MWFHRTFFGLPHLQVNSFWNVCFREENWSGKAPKNGTEERPEGEAEDRGNYDGPPGMDPDGVIESNWDKVSSRTPESQVAS